MSRKQHKHRKKASRKLASNRAVARKDVLGPAVKPWYKVVIETAEKKPKTIHETDNYITEEGAFADAFSWLKKQNEPVMVGVKLVRINAR